MGFVLWYTTSAPRLLGPPEYWTDSWVLSFLLCMTKARSDSTLSAASKRHAWKHMARHNAQHLLLLPLVTRAQSSGLMEAGGSDTFGSQSRKEWDTQGLKHWGQPGRPSGLFQALKQARVYLDHPWQPAGSQACWTSSSFQCLNPLSAPQHIRPVPASS